MNLTIFSILGIDALTTGAVYALVAIALVLVFAVTRIIFVPQGEFVVFGAMTLAVLNTGAVPGTVWLLLMMVSVAVVAEMVRAQREAWPALRRVKRLLWLAAWPVVVSVLTVILAPRRPPLLVQVLLTLAVVAPMGPLLYQLAYRRVAASSVLVLLVVSVGVHLALSGLALAFFGPEGVRTPAFSDANLSIGSLQLSAQGAIILAAAAIQIVVLFLFMERTLSGKALRATAVNRTGARLMGISTDAAGAGTLGLAAFIGAVCGVVMAPTMTVAYDAGFLIALKGFVAAVVGGMASFPLALLGALGVAAIEVAGSFWASAFKEVIVFTAILPVLLWLSLTHRHVEEH